MEHLYPKDKPYVKNMLLLGALTLNIFCGKTAMIIEIFTWTENCSCAEKIELFKCIKTSVGQFY